MTEEELNLYIESYKKDFIYKVLELINEENISAAYEYINGIDDLKEKIKAL